MGMDRILSKVLRPLSPDKNYTIQDFIDEEVSKPLNYFGNVRGQAIESAIAWLEDAHYGIVEIPPIENTDRVSFLISNLDHEYRARVSYVKYGKHAPNTADEHRGLIREDEDWVAGDIILNENPESYFTATGWICIESGSPGKWADIGHYRRHYSDVEVVEELPDPNEINDGRLILMNTSGDDPEAGLNLLYCIENPMDSGNYVWIRVGGNSKIIYPIPGLESFLDTFYFAIDDEGYLTINYDDGVDE